MELEMLREIVIKGKTFAIGDPVVLKTFRGTSLGGSLAAEIVFIREESPKYPLSLEGCFTDRWNPIDWAAHFMYVKSWENPKYVIFVVIGDNELFFTKEGTATPISPKSHLGKCVDTKYHHKPCLDITNPDILYITPGKLKNVTR